jgi:hypothetical protein
MSDYWTYARIKTKVEQDLDLQDETFIEESEMIGYCNEAIDEAEAEIHGLYEDYFLSRANLTLVLGQEEYSLPTGIYAHKIRRVLYNNGSETFTVKRVKDWKKFEVYSNQTLSAASNLYGYFVINSAAASPKILLMPAARENGAVIQIWFIRNANNIVLDTDVCDIPEFVNFVMQFMKVRCYEKEVGHPNLQMAIAALEQQRTQMRSTLAAMVPDADNEIEMDMTPYDDHN